MLESKSRKKKKIVPPDLSKLLQEYKRDYEEFMKFCDKLDKKLAEGKTKSKARKKTTGSKKKSQTESGLSPEEKKIRSKNLAHAKENCKRLGEARERSVEEALISENIVPDNRQGAYKEFIDQLRKDILLIHLASDKYVCLCVKKGEKWRQLWVYTSEVYDCTAHAYIMRGIEGGILFSGGLIFRLERMCESSFGAVDKQITAIVEKTLLEYTALKGYKAVSRGECLKHETPPPFLSGISNRLERIGANEKAKVIMSFLVVLVQL